MATSDTSMIGREIARYVLLERIGAGGMGVVYRARDTQLDRLVALKLIPPDRSGDGDRKRRFLHEARAASALNHANIVHIYEVGEQNGTDFIAMEFVPGKRLDALIPARGLPVSDVLSYAVQITDALAKAHAEGIIHRDLKPSNVMIRDDGLVKILDFGLAKHILPSESDEQADTMTALVAGPRTEQGIIVGTAAYMSPEQAEGRLLDARSDIFSFGALFYEMLTGRRAFRGDSPMATMAAILRDEPVPLRELRPDAPAELERIVSLCLRKETTRRMQHIADVRVALLELKDQSESARFRTPSSGRYAVAATGEPRRRLLSKWLVAGIAIPAALAVVYLARPELPAPRPLRTIQLTNTHRGKIITVSLQPRFVVGAPILTDGARVYFAEQDFERMSATRQMSSEGGEVVDLPLPPSLRTGFDPVAMAPSGTEMLLFGPPQNASWTGGLWTLPLPAGASSRVGDLLATDAAYSNDGKRLVFTRKDRVLVANRDGTGVREIARVNGVAIVPRWHPGQELIRFSSFDTDLQNSMLWEVHADGSGLHRLLEGWSNPAQDCCGDWTPDGDYFLFESRQNGTANLYAIREQGTLLRRANPEPVQLTTGPLNSYRPVPSKDGSRIFFVGEQRRGELSRYDPRVETFVPFLPDVSADSLAFSPDGKSVSWVAFPEGTLWRSDVNGGQRVQLSFGPSAAALPQWSPDGSEIAFVKRDAGRPAQISIVPSSGGPAQEIPTDGKDQGEPSWSPDGIQIVFGRAPWYRKPGPESPDTAIYVWDRVTGTTSKLPGSDGLFSARWSHGGRYIAALRFSTGALVIFDREGGNWRTLGTRGMGWPWWSKGDEYLYATRDEYLVRVRLSDGAVEPWLKLVGIPRIFGTNGYWIGYTPDESPIILRDVSLQEIFALEWKRP